MKNVVILDVDGSIVDCRIRQKLCSYQDKNGKVKLNWGKFFDPVIIWENDIIRYDIIAMANAYKIKDPDVKILVFSGRAAGVNKIRDQDLEKVNKMASGYSWTLDNINKVLCEKFFAHAGLMFDSITMRERTDMRGDDVLKKEFFDQQGLKPENILAVIDDRPRVVALWKSMGLNVIDVNLEPEKGFW